MYLREMKLHTFRILIPLYCFLLIVTAFLAGSCVHKSENPGPVNSFADTNKVNNLLGMEDPFSTQNPKLAIYYNKQAIYLSENIGYKKGYINGIMNIGRICLNQKDYKNAKRLFLFAYNYSMKESMMDFTPKCLGCLGMVCESEYSYADAADYYLKGKEAFSKIGDSTGIIKCCINISNVYKTIGDRAKAVNYIVEGLRIAEIKKDDILKGKCLNNLSILYQDMDKNEDALSLSFQSMEICKKTNDSIGLAEVYNNIAVTYQAIKKKDLAMKYYLLSAEIKQKLNNKYGVAVLLNNIGSLKFDDKEYQEALHYFSKALEISKEIKEQQLTSRFLRNVSNAYVSLGKFDDALNCLNESLSIAEKIGANEEKYDALYYLTDLYEKKGDYKLAFRYLKNASTFNDTLLQLHNISAIEEIKAHYETEKKEKQILELNEEKKYSRLTTFFLYCFSIMLIIIVVIIIYNHKNKLKKNKEIAEYQKSLVERKLKIVQLNEINLEQKLEHSEKELINMTLYIVQKIDFVETLRNEIKIMQKEPEISKEEIVNKLSNLLTSNLRIDKERIEFQLYFEKANLSFYKKLEKKFPSITPNEIKLSALLRLNLSSKDISSICNISPSSVDMNRYRLRKKFNLTPDDNLTAFLKGI